jgi:uncharacterized protein
MTPLAFILLLVAGFMGGLVDSIAGGGGLITVPALMTLGLPPTVVLGTNKVAASFGSFTSSARYLRAGYVQPLAWPMAGLAFVSSMVGAKVATVLPAHDLKALILTALLLVGGFILLRPDFGADSKPHSASPQTQKLLTVLFAIGIGFYDGMVGPGTGSFLAFFFVMLLGRDLLSATANTKVVNFATNFGSVLIFAANGNVRWAIALPFGLSILAGAYIGSGMAMNRGVRFIRVILVTMVFLVVIKLWAS